jgi:hypothetical protein
MSAKFTPRGIVNAYFAESGFMKPGSDFWKSLNFDAKQKFRGYVKAMRKEIGEGTAEEQLEAFSDLLPPDLSSNMAKVWLADPRLKQFVLPNRAQPPVRAILGQLAIEGPQPPVKGANEASLTSSSSIATVPSARDPEDGDDGGGSFTGGKRPRSAESFSALQGSNNAFMEAEPKRQSVRKQATAPDFGQIVPFVEDTPDESKEGAIGFSAGFKEIMRQSKAAATRDNADPEFKMQAGAADADVSGQLIPYNDGERSPKAPASVPPDRVNKESLRKDQGTSDRQIRAIASSKESRMAKANSARKPADFVRDLTSGGMFRSSMFGSAAEIVGGSASAGTGIGSALIGGGSGSVLDRMIASNSSDSTMALVNTIGKMIVASGAGGRRRSPLEANRLSRT